MTGDGLPLQGLGFDNAPPIAYMGCLRSDGRERLLERFAQNNVSGASVVNSAVLATPYAGLVVYSLNAHYGGEWNTMQVFDLRTGLLTKLGGETTGCDFMGCPFAGFDRVVLGNDGMSAVDVDVVDSVGSLSTAIRQVSCAPASTICIAIDGPARLLSSTDPAAGAAAWTTGTLTGGLFAIACPAASLCVGVGTKIQTSTNPGGGVASWTATGFPAPGEFADAVSCPSATLCVAARVDGIVAASTDPTGGTGAWSAATIDSNAALNAAFCTTLPKCFITDSSQRVLTSSSPTGGASAWSRSNRTPAFLSGTCPTSTLCLAVNGTHIFTSTDPAAEAWTATSVPDDLDGIACPTTSLCLAVGTNGALEISTDPAAGAWTRTRID